MKEPAFINKQSAKWEQYEHLLQHRSTDPDVLVNLYIEILDDLAFVRTQYPESQLVEYLNQLAGKVYLKIYKTKRNTLQTFWFFWKEELPLMMYEARYQLLYSFLFFTLAILIGVVSAQHDIGFVRTILGNQYVDMTIENIKKGDPMAVYKQDAKAIMFVGITNNNIMVAFRAFIAGVFFSLGTIYILFMNGVMLGVFQYFFYHYDLWWISFTTIWIHGTLEISAIVIAGAAGLTVGNSILFPGTYTRMQSFARGGKRGAMIVLGLVPIFIMAGFLESYVTRLTELPDFVKLAIIGGSLYFILFYFVWYPRKVYRYRNNTPRFIPTIEEMRAMTNNTTTIQGPVGMLGKV